MNKWPKGLYPSEKKIKKRKKKNVSEWDFYVILWKKKCSTPFSLKKIKSKKNLIAAHSKRKFILESLFLF